MTNASPLQSYWEQLYESTATPFDAAEPDEWVVSLGKSGKIRGHVLDAGCGPGRTSLYLADLGYRVTGIDISDHAIERAQRKAAQSGSTARFAQADLCDLSGCDHSFDTVIDIGCFHSIYAHDRPTYVAALHRACRPGAVVYMRAFSVRNKQKGDYLAPGTHHSPDVREDQIRAAFSSDNWAVKELVEKEVALFIGQETRIKAYVWYTEIHRQ